MSICFYFIGVFFPIINNFLEITVYNQNNTEANINITTEDKTNLFFKLAGNSNKTVYVYNKGDTDYQLIAIQNNNTLKYGMGYIEGNIPQHLIIKNNTIIEGKANE